MPQNAQIISSVAVNEQELGVNAKPSNYSAPEGSQKNSQLRSVMSDLNRLSRSFVDSYQNLEGQVEQLSGQLLNASEQRSEAIEEKQKLIDEKHTITNRLHDLLAILPSGVVVLDGKGVVSDCNAVATDILGRPLLGAAWLDVISRSFMPQADDGHQISLKDGRKVHIETRALDSEPGQLIVLTDMTKTRQLQAELSQQQKLSSIGNMVASLAHQIRTPLSAAILYGSHLAGNKLADEKKQEFSGLLLERLNFMERQISDMLNFVKGERKVKDSIQLNNLIERIESGCAHLNHLVSFDKKEIIHDSYRLNVDADALIGAVANLIDNAIDASNNTSSESGNIGAFDTNKSASIHSDKKVQVNFSVGGDSRFIVEVVDQGTGIRKDKFKDLFEPFYSTKSHGNGLGLSIVHGVVIDHKGDISVESELGEGSSFIIELPLETKKDWQQKPEQNIQRHSLKVDQGVACGH
ncbi:MAG: ATP-binding protein [Kangiellaceae bacterium]|nr:ATP-binding protein [Kangiellaceae bacterium]